MCNATKLSFNLTEAVKDPRSNSRFRIEAHKTINRRYHRFNYGNALPIGGFDVGNEVTINLLLEAVKPEPKK